MTNQSASLFTTQLLLFSKHVAYNWWKPGKFIALHVKAWKINWELLCTSHVNQRNMKGYKYLNKERQFFLTNSLAVLHNWNWRYNLKIKIKKRRSKLMQSFNEVSSPFGLWALVAFQLQRFRIYNSILFHAGYLLGTGHASSTVHPCNQILDTSTWSSMWMYTWLV